MGLDDLHCIHKKCICCSTMEIANWFLRIKFWLTVYAAWWDGKRLKVRTVIHSFELFICAQVSVCERADSNISASRFYSVKETGQLHRKPLLGCTRWTIFNTTAGPKPVFLKPSQVMLITEELKVTHRDMGSKRAHGALVDFFCSKD